MIGTYLLVGMGGAGGACCRYLLTGAIKRRWNGWFPAATYLINLCGSFLLGLLLCVPHAPWLSLLLGTGFLGGFTTFSTFQAESLTLLCGRQQLKFWIYWIGSVAGGIAAALGAMLLFS